MKCFSQSEFKLNILFYIKHWLFLCAFAALRDLFFSRKAAKAQINSQESMVISQGDRISWIEITLQLKNGIKFGCIYFLNIFL